MSSKSHEHRSPQIRFQFSFCVCCIFSSLMSDLLIVFTGILLISSSVVYLIRMSRMSHFFVSLRSQILSVKRVKAPPIFPVAQTTTHYIYNTFIHPPPPCHKQTTPSNPSSSAPLSHLPRLATDGQAPPPPYHSLAPPYTPPRDRSSTPAPNSN